MLSPLDSNEVKINELLSEFAISYSKYFKTDLTEQTVRLSEFIEESLAKLDEFQSLFQMKRDESAEWCEVIIPLIIQQGNQLTKTFNERFEKMQALVRTLKLTLDELETQISIAENSLGISSPFLSVFKYFRKTENIQGSSANEYKPIPLPNIAQYFKEGKLSTGSSSPN